MKVPNPTPQEKAVLLKKEIAWLSSHAENMRDTMRYIDSKLKELSQLAYGLEVDLESEVLPESP